MPTQQPQPPRRKLNNRSHIMTRYGGIVVIFLAVAFAIVIKLMYATIIDAGAWNERAEREMKETVDILPERGNILASNGSILACNQTLYDVRIDLRHPRFGINRLDNKKWAKLDSLADSLDHYYPRNPYIHENRDSMERYSWKALMHRQFALSNSKRYGTLTIARKLTREQYDKICSWPFLKDIKSQGKRAKPIIGDEHVVRRYPFGNMARLSIGRVCEDSATHRIVGYAGLEKALDKQLSGKVGKALKVAKNNGFEDWIAEPAVRGYDILSTIDIDIQDILEAELLAMCDSVKAEWGTAIIMEVNSGEIKAISNIELDTKTGEYTEALNRAVLPYEPGSVMKPISLMVAFEDGLVKSNNDTENCAPFMRTSDHAGGGYKTMRQIIATSSNTGIARVIFRGYEKHPEKFRERLKSMGFFEPMNSGIGNEQKPVVPVLYDRHPQTGQPITMLARHLDLARQAYGYNTLIPPLYTLSYYNAIANEGRYVRPHLVRALRDENGRDSVLKISYIRDPLCSKQTARQVKECLYDVVWDKRGTGRALQDDRVKICGKTGTAIPYDEKVLQSYDHSKRRFAFAGFFPYDKPRYSCMVVMTAPAGSTSAARGSGRVLLNVALKLFARGMLSDPAPYKAEATPASPKLYGSIIANTASLINHLGLNNASKFRTKPEVTSGRVPDPSGLDLPSALSMLEKAGLNVAAIEGTGYVAAITPSPGTPISKGSDVKLKLRWN